jgi:putative membrane protein
MLDVILAWIHFMFIFGLVGTLFAEFFFYQRTLRVEALQRLQRVDLAYGVIAAGVIASGVARVIYSPKTAAFYMHDTIFWTKMTLFLTVGLVSIIPTRHFLRLSLIEPVDGAITAPEATYVTMRRILAVEVVLLLFIPLCATLMAHGYGYR